MILVNFTYLELYGEKVHVTILERFSHHFTGESFFKIRREGERGWVSEDIWKEEYLRGMFVKRVEA